MRLTSKYQTYRTVGYDYQILGSDPRSTGGVHHHQAKLGRGGQTLVRIMQTNGRFSDCTVGKPATAEQIEMIRQAE